MNLLEILFRSKKISFGLLNKFTEILKREKNEILNFVILYMYFIFIIFDFILSINDNETY